MTYPVALAINAVAEIFGRRPFSPRALLAYRRAVDVQDDAEFVQRLLELLRTCKHFPVPADFNAMPITSTK